MFAVIPPVEPQAFAIYELSQQPLASWQQRPVLRACVEQAVSDVNRWCSQEISDHNAMWRARQEALAALAVQTAAVADDEMTADEP
jgi:hypothetical protein